MGGQPLAGGEHDALRRPLQQVALDAAEHGAEQHHPDQQRHGPAHLGLVLDGGQRRAHQQRLGEREGAAEGGEDGDGAERPAVGAQVGQQVAQPHASGRHDRTVGRAHYCRRP